MRRLLPWLSFETRPPRRPLLRMRPSCSARDQNLMVRSRKAASRTLRPLRVPRGRDQAIEALLRFERAGWGQSLPPGLDDVNLKTFHGRCGFAVSPGGNKIKTVGIFPLDRLRRTAPPGRIGRRKCNACCLGNMGSDRSLCFRERRYERASCQIARCHRSSEPISELNLRHSEWSAAYSRSLRSGWPAEPSRRPSRRQ